MVGKASLAGEKGGDQWGGEKGGKKKRSKRMEEEEEKSRGKLIEGRSANSTRMKVRVMGGGAKGKELGRRTERT